MSEAAYNAGKAQKLIGAELVDVQLTGEEEFGYEAVVLVFRGKDGKEFGAVVLRDPEGNGPGWLDVQEAE